MLKASSRLLILLVLIAAAMSATWANAQARSADMTQGTRVGSVSIGNAAIATRPGTRPGSGEPDAGSGKIPPAIVGQLPSTDPGDDPPLPGMLQWISRVWLTRLLGVR